MLLPGLGLHHLDQLRGDGLRDDPVGLRFCLGFDHLHIRLGLGLGLGHFRLGHGGLLFQLGDLRVLLGLFFGLDLLLEGIVQPHVDHQGADHIDAVLISQLVCQILGDGLVHFRLLVGVDVHDGKLRCHLFHVGDDAVLDVVGHQAFSVHAVKALVKLHHLPGVEGVVDGEVHFHHAAVGGGVNAPVRVGLGVVVLSAVGKDDLLLGNRELLHRLKG